MTSTRLAPTRDQIYFSDNGRVRLERHPVWRKGKNKTGYFLTVKFGLGAGYIGGATFSAGTRVKAYKAWGQGVYFPRFKMRLTRNGNHKNRFYPGWW